jgi:hypothetical protein
VFELILCALLDEWGSSTESGRLRPGHDRSVRLPNGIDVGKDLVCRGLPVAGERGEVGEDVELVGAEIGTLSVGLLNGLRTPRTLLLEGLDGLVAAARDPECVLGGSLGWGRGWRIAPVTRAGHDQWL